MREEINLNPAQRELESAFRSLTPAAAQVSPVAAAFAAGRRSSVRRARLWQSGCVAALLMAAGSWLMPMGQISAPVDRATPALAHDTISPALEPLPAQSVLRLQQVMRDSGLDGLPAPNLPSSQVVHARDVF